MLAEAVCAAKLAALLLGDAAHEEVLSRSGPIFTLLLTTSNLDDETLDLLWSACANKSASVASATASLLVELLHRHRCPERLHERLVEALTGACSDWLSDGVANLLAILSPTYMGKGSHAAEKYLLLLVTAAGREPILGRRPRSTCCFS